ncbi:putative toxin-antitoxin system, antitoxin component, ribbon-helix-helix domain protein [Enterococcus faecalis 06-MB-DW-09]|nr:putative toxin-antitoxin system, antitoxin component, ribbon-helix-helix domain protein [Enterococcus faecalis 06-MB-DW-09]
MSTITFRVSDEEKEFLEKISEFENVSLSDFVRQQAIKAAEDLVDYQTYRELMEEHKKKDESISHEQMMKELGL